MSKHTLHLKSKDISEVEAYQIASYTDLLPQYSDAPCRDYNFRAYKPRVNSRGRAHSATMLLCLARHVGMQTSVRSVIERLWEHLGRDQVVWGVKWTHDGFHSFEFYIYNREESRPLQIRSISSLRRVLRPWLDDSVPPNDACNYTMCSFELDIHRALASQASKVHIYVAGGNEKRRHESFSYGVLPDGLLLENHYTWYYASSELEEIRQRLNWSVHASDERAWPILLPLELCNCLTIAYATKPTCDGLYFNRVTTNQLYWFAQQFLPPCVESILRAIGEGFDHLFWDVGFDFSASTGSSPINLCKFGVYGYV